MSHDADGDQHDHRAAPGDHVPRVDAEQHAGGGAGRRESRHRAQHGADSHDDGPLLDDEAEHVAGSRSQRHADADLLRPPHDSAGDDAVQADRGEPDGHQSRRTEHCREKPCREQLRRRVVAQRQAFQKDHVRVDRPQLSLHGCAKRAGTALGAREQHRGGQKVAPTLGRREVDVGGGRLLQKADLVVAGDADNLERGATAVRTRRPNPPSDGAPAGPETPGERLVDDRHRWRAGRVDGVVEWPPFEDRHPQGLEIPLADGHGLDRQGQRIRCLLVGRLDAAPVEVDGQRRTAGPRDRLHAGQPAHPFPRAVEEAFRLVLVVAGQAQGDGDRCDLPRRKAGLDAAGHEQVPRQETRHDEQHEADGDLQRHQCLAQAPTPTSNRPPETASGELAQHARPRTGPRRHQSGRDAGSQRYGDRQREHPTVQRQIERDGNQQRHAHGAKSLQEAPGQSDAAGHTQQRQHQALDEQLPQQTSPARPDRETQTDLPPPRRRPRQQEPRDVRAGDQQHQSDQHEQAERARAQAIFEYRMGRHVARRDHRHAESVVRIGVRRFEPQHYPVQVVGGAAGGFAVPEASLDQHPVKAATLESGGSGRGRSAVHHRRLDVVDPGHRHPERGREDGRRHASEAPGRHADDGVGATANRHRPSDRARILREHVRPESR